MFNLVMILLLVAVFTLVLAFVTNRLETPLTSHKGKQAPPFLLTDYVYRDDFGNEYVVTSADISDNYSLLIEDHDLTLAYIQRHVFLADTRPVN